MNARPDEHQLLRAFREYLECIDRGECVKLDEFLEKYALAGPELKSLVSTSEQFAELARQHPSIRYVLPPLLIGPIPLP